MTQAGWAADLSNTSFSRSHPTVVLSFDSPQDSLELAVADDAKRVYLFILSPLLLMIPSSLLPLFALVSLVVAEPVDVRLVRRSPLRKVGRRDEVDLSAVQKAADRVRNRYGFKSPVPAQKRAQTVGINLINTVSALDHLQT